MASRFCASVCLWLMLAIAEGNRLRSNRSAVAGVQVAVSNSPVSYSGNPTLKADCGEAGDESVYPKDATTCYSKSEVVTMPQEVAAKTFGTAADACNACKFTAIASCSEYCRCTCYASPEMNIDGSSQTGHMFECVDTANGLVATESYTQCNFGAGSVDKFGETSLPLGTFACHADNRDDIVNVPGATC
eukprot:TRINITY_DN4572_c0_g2_i1.p1 TRINITY_DN4572_c0_g2~~TRINITY_DN4572_c0_g2_i1.p1  ORF type:complete len:189 (-),score=28.86 TRINITY_DN4572_c0_g2_i1:57-623(-)